MKLKVTKCSLTNWSNLVIHTMTAKKILYVEDNDDNVYMLKPRLERKGYEVLIAGDGREGVYLANNKKPDLILMDLELPILDGWEATRHLKNDPNTRHIPVIALTANAMEDSRQRAIDVGCDDFDIKPVNFELLMKKINSLLPEETGQDNEVKMVVDDQSRFLIVDDNEDNRYTLSEYLKREGFTNLETAENGRIALEKLNNNKFDLVLMDLKMPEMDGIEALRHIKNDENLRHIPVVMISAADEIENVTRCIEIGAEGYLPKPFNSMILRARINASLGKMRLHEQEHIKNVAKGKEQADLLRIANELIATKCARKFFRACLFVPLVVPLPFLIFKGDEGLSALFISTLVFDIPPYFLFILLPFIFLFGKMTEKQILISTIFFPIVFPILFSVFWLIAPRIISSYTSVSITLSNPTQWIFITIVIPASYSIIFLSCYIVRRKLIKWEI